MKVRFEPQTANAAAQIHVPIDRDDGSLAAAIDQAITTARAAAATNVELWIHAVTEQADAIALSCGAVPYRDLWQLRCQLPTQPSSLTTRAFTLADLDSFITVNNRAFSWHPEQSGLDQTAALVTMAEPWFDPDGFRLYESNGELLGFCWTKLHHDLTPVVGEIYVIAIDPSAHGRGLGVPMTLAGLDWIHAQGVDTAMLYVESDNDAANATYKRIGFALHHIDRAYEFDLTAAHDPNHLRLRTRRTQ